jgi:ectoine hydroxylase-related dioxygenase (phytanoyl-CoA dioxygenase family)
MKMSCFERDGFVLHRDVVQPETIERLLRELAPRAGSPNRRNLLQDSATIAAFVQGPMLKPIADRALGADAFAVRAILFDKVAGANWSVPWHQDLVIPVAARIENAEFSGWSVKDGVPHVLPPAEVLAAMVTLRLHLEDCGPENAPLRVLPGSHRMGKLDDQAIPHIRATTPEFICHAPRGSVLAMRPLLLHASSAAARPGHRRVLHVEYAAKPLPGALRWFDAFAPSEFQPLHS